MQYLLLVYLEEANWAAIPEAQKDRLCAECDAYADEMTQKGVFLGGAPLQRSVTARTIRRVRGQQLVTDGPFAETKEVLAGYHLVECKDMDEAMAWGAKFPGIKAGATIEVRPLLKPAR